MIQSFMLGILMLTLLFFFCLFIVMGAKICYSHLKTYLVEKLDLKPKKAPSQPKKSQSTPKPKPKPKPIRSIEINPNEVDRIYVTREN